MSTRRLYDHPDSPNCRKIRVLLAALVLPYERHEIDLLGSGPSSPELLAVNPYGQLPVLVDGEVVLPESNAILGYLAERYGPEWLPRDLAGRAQVARWMYWQTSGPSRTIAAVGYERFIKPLRGGEPDEVKVEEHLRAWQRPARHLDQHLARHEMLVGSRSVADVAVGVWVELASRAGMLEGLPHVQRWLQQLTELPAWTSAGGYRLLGGEA